MMLSNVRDVDFTIARIHAHHASMIDGERLEAMCRIRTIPELARHIWGEANPAMSSGELQRRFFADFAEEVEHLASKVPEGVRLFFEVLKECRNTFQHISLESDIEKACEYYAELLQRAHSCKAPHNKDAVEIAAQEAGIFLGMLSLRLTFNYAFKPEKVESFFFEGSALSRLQFAQITHAKDLEEALNVCSGSIAPGNKSKPFVTIPELERAAWDRYYKIAKRIWATDCVGVGAIIGYVGLRRIEVSNVVTLSEGLRLGVDSRRLRTYLIPHVKS